jgi:cytochrome c553
LATDARPPRPPTRRALLAAAAALLLAAAAAPSADLEALSLEGDPVRGARIYESCAPCHLPDGAGRGDGSFPQLAGQHARVVVKQLLDIRSGRRANPVMAPFAEMLVDARDLADVAAYVAALPVPAEAGRGPGDDLERGRALYERDCARCHGSAGEGNAETLAPVLGGQHYRYLLRQARDIAGGRRREVHPEARAVLAGYSDAELIAVCDFASRLPGRRQGSPGTPPAPREPSGAVAPPESRR